MARLTIPDEQTFATFTVVTSTTAFPITFSLFAKADLTVLVDDVALTQSDFTFTGTVLDGGGYDGGTVTLNTAVDDVTVRIERNVAPARTSNFAPSSSVPVQSVDAAFNRLTATQQDIDRRVGEAEAVIDDADGSIAASVAAAAASASSASGSAFTATTQAGISTAQAVISTDQAGLSASARIAAEAARDLAQQYVSDAATASGVFVPIYASKVSATGALINISVDRIYVGGYATVNDGGAGYYKRAAANPSRAYTSFQDSLGVWWELDAHRPNSLQYGIFSTETAANTTLRAQAMIDENGGKSMDWLAGGGNWTTNRIFLRNVVPNEKMIIYLDPALTITGGTGAASVIYISRTSNIKMVSKGAIIDGPADIVSHALYLEGADDCEFEGIIFKGGASGGGGKDAAYLGGGDSTGTDPCQRITFTDCSFIDSRRNGLSIVEAFGVYFHRCIFSGAVGAPGAGCDVEANLHGTVGRIRFFDCQFNDNQNCGLVVVFGDDVKTYRCSATGNGLQGFLSGAGGTQFNQTVYRPGYDRTSVTAIATATGWVTVVDASRLVPGHIISTSVRNGYTLPAEMPSGYFFVMDINGNDIRLSTDGRTTITAYSTAGSGGTSFTTDPFTSNLSFQMFTEGQSSNIQLVDFVASGNGGTSDIGVATSVNVRLERGDVNVTGVSRRAASFSITRDIAVTGFDGTSDGTTGTSPIITYGTCSFVREQGLKARGAPGGGVSVGPVLAYTSVDAEVINCGNASYGCFQMATLTRAQVRGLKMFNDAAHPAVSGLAISATAIDSVFTDVETRGSVGTTNATSLNDLGTGNRFIRCRQFDGGYRGEGSKTHDFPSVPARTDAATGGFGTSTTVSVTGAKVGDHFTASLGIYYAGLVLHAVCHIANNVTVTPQNTTGVAIDPASTTLTVRAVN